MEGVEGINFQSIILQSHNCDSQPCKECAVCRQTLSKDERWSRNWQRNEVTKQTGIKRHLCWDIMKYHFSMAITRPLLAQQT